MNTPGQFFIRCALPLAGLCICGCLSNEADPATTPVDPPASVENSGEKTATREAGKSPPAAPKSPVVDAATEFKFVAPQLADEELREGWISLFDGATLFGWDVPEETNWRVEENCIVADQGEISLLSTPFAFDDFEFRCDFHLEEGGNSGVFLRTAAEANDPTVDTYELNICDGHPSHATGSLVGRFVAENVPAVEGAWHRFHVRCEGTRITVQLDESEIVSFNDETQASRMRGTIGLQHNKGRIAFRNVFLRPLESQDLFNGIDLSGFRDVPGSSSQFTVQDGMIHAESGPGFLETEATYDDFILHVESNIADAKAIADGRPANSGVFFRAMTGTADAPSHGYEMQIQHDYKDDDRTKPLDYGSGAIYRRQAARYIVANNNEWVTQTLIAQGNRIATFVNGYQVLNWVDEREQNDNPRKGLRTKAGHISLQGHDPTTDLLFRSIRIHPLARATAN